jgi:hypothetical protein
LFSAQALKWKLLACENPHNHKFELELYDTVLIDYHKLYWITSIYTLGYHSLKFIVTFTHSN